MFFRASHEKVTARGPIVECATDTIVIDGGNNDNCIAPRAVCVEKQDPGRARRRRSRLEACCPDSTSVLLAVPLLVTS